MSVFDAIRDAGVVGAGGAGFPTHCKFAPNIDTLLVNAVECEPLLYTDFHLLENHLQGIVEGAEAFALELGAKEVLICVKKHNGEVLHLFDGQAIGKKAVIRLLPDVYPMGDEIVMIYQATGKVVPPGQLPSAVGTVVINAETAYNIAEALKGRSVTHKWLTIGGAVERPIVCRVPIGTSVAALFAHLGIKAPQDHVVLDGGPAMGLIIDPSMAIVHKKTKGLLILPREISAISAKLSDPNKLLKRTSSECCQCTFCTDMCPRALLGYPLAPHKTLRGAGMKDSVEPGDILTASLCSGCGVCTLIACCQNVAPGVVMSACKAELNKQRLGYRANEATRPDENRDFRMIPKSRFARRIGVESYDRRPVWTEIGDIGQKAYRLPLSQHVGKPSLPCVQAGEKVKAGQKIADAQEGISAALHSPVEGTIKQIGEEIVVEV